MLKINKSKSSVIFCLAIIFLIALFFRLANLDDFFISSDTVWQAQTATRLFPNSWNNFINLIIEVHGMAAPLIGVLMVLIARVFSFPVTEFVWNFPFILLGSATIFPAYLLARRLVSQKAGLIAAFFIAVYPWHVHISRFSGFGHCIVSIFLEISALLTIVNYYSNPNKKNKWLFTVFLSLDILFGLFFPFLIILIPLVAILLNYRKSLGKAFEQFLHLTFRWPIVVIPVLAAFVQLLITTTGLGVLNRGGASLDAGWGFHLSRFFYNGTYFSNSVIFPILIVLTFFSFTFLKAKNKSSVLVLWIYITALPYLFYFPRYPTRYFIQLIVPMLILAAIWIDKLWKNKERIFASRSAAIIALVIIGGIFVLFSIGGVYRLDGILTWQKDTTQIRYYQSDRMEIANPGNGIKAASYWIRENTEVSDVIFAYNVGGFGLEPTVLDYYARRPYVSLHDARLAEMNILLKKAHDHIDYLLVEAKNNHLVIEYIEDDFFQRAVVQDNAKPVLYIYSKERIENLEKIDLATFAEKFDQKYSTYPTIIDYSSSYSYFEEITKENKQPK